MVFVRVTAPFSSSILRSTAHSGNIAESPSLLFMRHRNIFLVATRRFVRQSHLKMAAVKKRLKIQPGKALTIRVATVCRYFCFRPRLLTIIQNLILGLILGLILFSTHKIFLPRSYFRCRGRRQRNHNAKHIAFCERWLATGIIGRVFVGIAHAAAKLVR